MPAEPVEERVRDESRLATERNESRSTEKRNEFRSADVKELFLKAADLPAEERAAYLDRACTGDAALRGRVEALLRAHDEPGSFPAADAGRLIATLDSHAGAGLDPGKTRAHRELGRVARGQHRPVQALAAARRRRHGCRLHGGADPAGPADGRAQDHPRRAGHPPSRRPLRGRAAGAGPHGPSEYRAGA